MTPCLWDWLQLLIVPAVLAIGGLWFNWQQNQRQQQLSEQQRKAEQARTDEQEKADRELALDQQREAMLQAYFDRMSELLLHHGLRKSSQVEEVRQVARVRTLATMRRLDGPRNGALLKFLQEAQLRELHDPIVDLSKAYIGKIKLNDVDLSNLNLSDINLYQADLSKSILMNTVLRKSFLEEANLSGALLFGTDLSDANLSKVDLSHALIDGVDLRGANISGAAVATEDLIGFAKLEGATMPDGSKYHSRSSTTSSGHTPTPS